MGAWRVERHYGVGAANVRLSAEPYAHPDRRWPLGEGLDRLRADLRTQGRSLRRAVTVMPAFLLVFAVLMSFVVTVVRDRIDDSEIQVVMWTPEPVVPEPLAPPEPPPIPPPAAPKPEPPKPPEPVVAKKPPPPPPAVKRPVPPPAPPKPLIAKAAPPPPPPKRVVRPAPPKPKPVVKMDALAKAPKAPSPTTQRTARARPAAELPSAAPVPKLAPLAAARAPETPPPPSARRFAGVRPPTSKNAPRPSVTPAMAAVPAARATADTAPNRARRRLPDARKSAPAAPRPDLAPATSSLAVRDAPSARMARGGVAAPTTSAQRRPDVQLAALAAPAATAAAPSGPTRASQRGARQAPTAGSARQAPDDSLAGVPLGSLASCVSDRQEDALKQRVVAAVTTQKQCVSAAGAYRFVETKNLNSFLMWVEPARGRAQGDRCDELQLALECLQSGRTR